MFETRLKFAMAGLLAAFANGIGVTGRGHLTAVAAEPAAAPSDADLSWIDRRVEAWQLTKEETRFDEIGWAKDLPEAQRLARAHQRPLFVFTYSGSATEANAIALRRC